jgi:hypothetical protein
MFQFVAKNDDIILHLGDYSLLHKYKFSFNKKDASTEDYIGSFLNLKFSGGLVNKNYILKQIKINVFKKIKFQVVEFEYKEEKMNFCCALTNEKSEISDLLNDIIKEKEVHGIIEDEKNATFKFIELHEIEFEFTDQEREILCNELNLNDRNPLVLKAILQNIKGKNIQINKTKNFEQYLDIAAIGYMYNSCY